MCVCMCVCVCVCGVVFVVVCVTWRYCGAAIIIKFVSILESTCVVRMCMTV